MSDTAPNPGAPATTDGSNPGTPPPPPQGQGQGLTQDEVNAIVARRVNEATAAARREIEATLGRPVDEAKDLLTKAEEARLAGLDEAERAKAEAEKARADAEKAAADAATRQAEADRVVQAARIERLLGRPTLDDEGKATSGAVRHDRIDPATNAALQFAAGSDLTGDELIEAAAAHVRSSFPEWFPTDSADSSSANGSGSPTPPPAGRPAGQHKPGAGTAAERGRALRQARHPGKG